MIHHWIYINQSFMTWLHMHNYKALYKHLALYNTTEKNISIFVFQENI